MLLNTLKGFQWVNEPGNYGADDFECENTICALNICKQTSWDDFSKAVSQALTTISKQSLLMEWWSLKILTFNSTTDSKYCSQCKQVRSITLGISSPTKGKLNFWVYLCLWVLTWFIVHWLITFKAHFWQLLALKTLSVHNASHYISLPMV